MKNLTLLASVLMVLTVAACKQETKTAPQVVNDPNVIAIAPSLIPSLKEAPVGTAQLSDTLRVAGRVDYDERQVARIGATVTGRITDLNVELGQGVQSGEPLAQLHSTELGNYQLAYIKAKSQVELHSRTVERAKLLLSADVIGSAELQKRQNELAVAQAEKRAAADQLRVLGMSPQAIERLGSSGSITSLSPVASTISGVVVERKVTRGQVVQPSDALFTVANLSKVWVTAQIPERDARLVKLGQSVAIEVPALADEPFTAKLNFVADVINPETRTIAVRTELDNKDKKLKPAMLATMLIQGNPQSRLVVPANAVVREENEDHVFVKIGENQCRLTKVKLGPEQEKMHRVLSGLNGQEVIVVDGAFHLNNERQRADMEGS